MKNRRIVTILVLILICLFININVFAIPEEVITVNGEAAVEITAGGEYSGAIYDSATKTLTLDNYSGDYIVLDFPDGDTVNIVLKGTNNILHAGGYAGGDINGLGVVSSNENELNINITGETGSKLNISGYSVGIYVGDGNISIENANIDFGDIESCLIYTMNGSEIEIIDTNIVSESDYFYAISGDVAHITFDNSSLISNDTSDNGVFCVFAGSSFDINDSNVKFYTVSNFISFSEDDDIAFTNCDIELGFALNFLSYYDFGKNVTFEDCNINIDDIVEFINIEGDLLVKDSKIDIKNADTFISANKVDIINSDVKPRYDDGSNPQTFDISVLYIIIGILSVMGISIAKFDLDLLKNK